MAHIEIWAQSNHEFKNYNYSSESVLDAALLNTQHYKVRIKGKVEQSRVRSSALPFTSV